MVDFRTLHVHADALVSLLKAISAGKDIKLAGAPIPSEAAISGVSFDEETHTLDVRLVSRWPDDQSPDAFAYAVSYGGSGTAGDWGAPRALAEAADA